MPNCAAVNCSNRGEKGFKLFVFPRNPDRRAQWVQNMRRDNWTPTDGARLCEKHFEGSQFEKNRQDGWKKLKANAVPTLFNVPNPPPMIDPPPRKSVYKVAQSPQLELQTLLRNLEVVEVDEPISTSVQQEEYVSSILQKDDTIPVLLEDSSSVPHNVEVNDDRGKNKTKWSIMSNIQKLMPTMPPDTHKISLKIIEAIKQHPILYISDVKGSAIKLQEFRQKVWRKISNELGLDPAWVRLRWKNLRDTYCRILKYKNKTEKGSRRKKWVFEDYLSFIKFPYEPDYQPQCVELSDEYIEEINSTSVNSDSLLDQLEDRGDEDYSEYLEVLEETTADPISTEDNQQQQISVELSDNNNCQKTQHDIDAYAQQIQSKYRKIRPKKVKYDNNDQNNADDTDVANNYGILSPSFKIEHLKLPTNNSVTINPILITNATPQQSSPTDDQEITPEEITEETKVDNTYLPLEKSSIELFFNSMSRSVKLLPPQAQAEIKMSVCRIVTEAEVRYSKIMSKKNIQRFIAPPGMIPKLILIPCSMIDNPESK